MGSAQTKLPVDEVRDIVEEYLRNEYYGNYGGVPKAYASAKGKAVATPAPASAPTKAQARAQAKSQFEFDYFKDAIAKYRNNTLTKEKVVDLLVFLKSTNEFDISMRNDQLYTILAYFLKHSYAYLRNVVYYTSAMN